jgi:hypothetical protein
MEVQDATKLRPPSSAPGTIKPAARLAARWGAAAAAAGKKAWKSKRAAVVGCCLLAALLLLGLILGLSIGLGTRGGGPSQPAWASGG